MIYIALEMLNPDINLLSSAPGIRTVEWQGDRSAGAKCSWA